MRSNNLFIQSCYESNSDQIKERDIINEYG